MKQKSEIKKEENIEVELNNKENSKILDENEKNIIEKSLNQLIKSIEKNDNSEENIRKIKDYIKKLKAERKEKIYEPKDISMWRICAYFMIYSFLGFVIETLFALFNYGVFESRQGFLYGPFCCIYGLGAVIIILVLNYKFFKNNHTLFIGGFIVGSIVEYFVSLFGELILNVKWWDYSDRFLNIGGRICFLYSIFWGLLGVYLMKFINPRVDKFINWLKKKVNYILLKIVTALAIIFLFFDCLISAYAINVFLIKVAVEKDLPVTSKIEVEKIYSELYENPEHSEFIEKYFSTEKMLLTYPNLTITLEDGSFKRISDLYPEVKNYYYKFDVKKSI